MTDAINLKQPERILVIDDNASIHEDFRKILGSKVEGPYDIDRAAGLLFDSPSQESSSNEDRARQSYEIESAYQGQDGLKMVRAAGATDRPYVMAFVDVRMPPGWDGIETSRRIWNEFPDMPIVICTAYSDYSWAEVVETLGQSDRLFILKKPFDISEVCQLVMAIHQRQIAEQNAAKARRIAEQLADERAEALTEVTRLLDELREKEARIRMIFDVAAEGIIVLKTDGTVESFNRAAEEMFNCKADEIVGRCMTMLMPEESRKQYKKELQTITDGSDLAANLLEHDIVMKRKDGTTFPAIYSSNTAMIGSEHRVVLTIRDITLRKRTESQLMQFRRLIDSAAQGFLMTGLDGIIFYANEAARRMLYEESIEAVEGNHFLSYVCESDQQWTQNQLTADAVADAKEHQCSELNIRRADWTSLAAECNIFTLKDEKDRPTCRAILMTDITQRKQNESELREYAIALEATNTALESLCDASEETNKAKNRFFASMSQALRTPLQNVLSFSQFGLDNTKDASTETLLGYFERINKSGQKMQTLIEDLLQLSRLETGQEPVVLASTDIQLMMHAVLDEMTPTFQRKNLDVEFEKPQVDMPVLADRIQLMRAIRNLIENAIKFSPDNGTIFINIDLEDQYYRITIRDRGIGIPEEELGQIFSKFIRSSRTPSEVEGIGLGLATCKEIVMAHHGKLTAENHPDGGAVFTMSIPVDCRKIREHVAYQFVEETEETVQS